MVPLHLSQLKSNKPTINLLMIENTDYDFDVEDDQSNPVYHFAWIKNLSRLVKSLISKDHCRTWFCDRCLCHFKFEKSFNNHRVDCKNVNKCRAILPKDKDKVLKFKKHRYNESVPFVVYVVWGCFCEQGFGSLSVFTGNLNTERLKRLYQRGLLLSAKKLFGEETDGWVLQEDNDPKHRSHLCTHCKEENGITTLDWSSHSPNTNPIENVRSIMKRKLQRKRVFNLQQLSCQVRQIWRSLPATCDVAVCIIAMYNN